MGKDSRLDSEEKCKAELDAALIAIRKSNRLLKQSILSNDLTSVEKQLVRIRANRWKLNAALRTARNLHLEEA